jgi:hypothetical protein
MLKRIILLLSSGLVALVLSITIAAAASEAVLEDDLDARSLTSVVAVSNENYREDDLDVRFLGGVEIVRVIVGFNGDLTLEESTILGRLEVIGGRACLINTVLEDLFVISLLYDGATVSFLNKTVDRGCLYMTGSSATFSDSSIYGPFSLNYNSSLMVNNRGVDAETALCGFGSIYLGGNSRVTFAGSGNGWVSTVQDKPSAGIFLSGATSQVSWMIDSPVSQGAMVPSLQNTPITLRSNGTIYCGIISLVRSYADTAIHSDFSQLLTLYAQARERGDPGILLAAFAPGSVLPTSFALELLDGFSEDPMTRELCCATDTSLVFDSNVPDGQGNFYKFDVIKTPTPPSIYLKVTQVSSPAASQRPLPQGER